MITMRLRFEGDGQTVDTIDIHRDTGGSYPGTAALQ